MPNGRCRMHGGLSPSGLAHPNTTHGRYSRDLPTRLAARYAQAQSDPELLSLRSELHLVDARLADVLGRVDTKEAGQHWANAAALVAAYQTAPDPIKQAEAFAGLAQAVSSGQGDYAAWGEVLALIERRRKLAETEMKTLSTMGQMISSERAMVLLAQVVAIVRETVTDRTQLAAISSRIGQLVHHGDTHRKP